MAFGTAHGKSGRFQGFSSFMWSVTRSPEAFTPHPLAPMGTLFNWSGLLWVGHLDS